MGGPGSGRRKDGQEGSSAAVADGRPTLMLQGRVSRLVVQLFREACGLQEIEVGKALEEAAELWLEQRYIGMPAKMDPGERRERMRALVQDGGVELTKAMVISDESPVSYCRQLVDAKIRNRCQENWDADQLAVVAHVRNHGMPGYGVGVVPE